MAAATYILEIDWNNDGDYGDAYENVTANTVSVETRRGRDYASQLTGRASPGRLAAVLKNPNGLYSSYNASSPLYGLILPGRKVRLRTTSPLAVTLWAGLLTRLIPAGTIDGITIVQLEATGTMSRLPGKKITVAKQTNQYTGALISAVLDDVGWPPGERAIDSGQIMVDLWFEADIDALSAIRNIEDTELGFVYESTEGYLVFEDNNHRLTGAHLTSQQTYSDDPSAAMSYNAIEQTDPIEDIYNELIVDVQNYTTAVSSSVLWTLPNEQPTIAPGVTLTLWAEYPNASVDSDIGALVSVWDTPIVGTDITQTGVSNTDIAVTATKFSNSMKLAITNNGPATATMTLIRARGIKVTKNAIIRISAEDTASASKYGKRTFQLPSKWLQSTNVAKDYADFLVSRYKDPTPRLMIRYIANKDAISLADALSREISDRVTVVATGAKTKLGIEIDFYVESIAHKIRDGGQIHEVELTLFDCLTDGDYWLLGTSELGIGTRLSY